MDICVVDAGAIALPEWMAHGWVMTFHSKAKHLHGLPWTLPL
jgi:hypothetical protein